MLKILLFMSLILSSISYSRNSFYVMDPLRQGIKYNLNIEEFELELTPMGIYTKNEIIMTLSAKNTPYENYSRQLELVLDFDVSNQTFFTDSWLWVNDTIVKGALIDKYTATEIYEEIVGERKDPSLLRKIHKGYQTQMQLRIYPLLPGKNRKIKLEYYIRNDYDANNNHVSSSSFLNLLRYSNSPVSGKVKINKSFNSKFYPEYSDFDFEDKGTYFEANFEGKSAGESDINFINFNDNYINLTEKYGEKFFQLSVDVDTKIELEKQRKYLFVIDYHTENTSFTSEELVESLKNIIKEKVGKDDMLNILISNNNYDYSNNDYKYLDDFNLSELNQVIKESENSLEDIINEASEYTEINGGNIILLSSSDLLYNKLVAEYVFYGIEDKLISDKEIYILDLTNSNANSSIVDNKKYHANQFLYEMIIEKCGGKLEQYYTNNNLSTSLENIVPSDFVNLEDLDVKVIIENGVIYDDYLVLNENHLSGIGKYYGESTPTIEVIGFYGSNSFSETKELEVLDDDLNLKQMWVGTNIGFVEKKNQTRDIANYILNTSIKNRVLSIHTAFLCLEPWMMHLLNDNEDNRNDDSWVTSVDLFKEDMSVISSYPNPASSFTNISIHQKNAKKLQILDLKGSLVFEIEDPQSNFQWDLRDLKGSKVEPGAYIILIDTGRDYYYFKLIVS